MSSLMVMSSGLTQMSAGAHPLVWCVRVRLEVLILLLLLCESLLLLRAALRNALLLISIARCDLAPLAKCIAFFVQRLKMVRASGGNVVHAGGRLRHRARSASMLGAGVQGVPG